MRKLGGRKGRKVNEERGGEKRDGKSSRCNGEKDEIKRAIVVTAV